MNETCQLAFRNCDHVKRHVSRGRNFTHEDRNLDIHRVVNWFHGPVPFIGPFGQVPIRLRFDPVLSGFSQLIKFRSRSVPKITVLHVSPNAYQTN